MTQQLATRQQSKLIIAESDSPRVAESFRQCQSQGLDVLNAYLSYAQETSRPLRIPSSRRLRHRYAQHLSRKEFAQGVRQLIALELLIPLPNSPFNDTLIIIVQTCGKNINPEGQATTCE